jgi:hypothetical protein
MSTPSRSSEQFKRDAVPDQEARAGHNTEPWLAIDSEGFPMTIQKPMTLQEAKSIARHLGLTLRKVRSGDYRVNFRDGDETTAHYTDNLEDAVNTAVEMARKRDYERRTVQSRSVI